MQTYNKFALSTAFSIVSVCTLLTLSENSFAEPQRAIVVEEIIVTAQKREQSLQETPIAISVLDAAHLQELGITSLDALGGGAISSLRIQPAGATPSTLIPAIRGNGPTDIGQTTRDGSVAVYIDGISIGQAQGLGMELVDLSRIEVLRGPQGTLFGRNATGGAINIISNKPAGKFGFRQTFGIGRYNDFKSITRIDLPEFAGISAKFDYLHSGRDGWVENTAAGESDYNAYEKDSGRLSINWEINEAIALDYAFTRAEIEETQLYFQLSQDNFGLVGVEPGRQTRTRFPIVPLDPTETEQNIHALTLTWEISDHLTFKSLSSLRDLREDTNNNFAGTLYSAGLIFHEEIELDQWSEEVQLIGDSDRIDWIAGLYFSAQETRQDTSFLFSLDMTTFPFTPIEPPGNFGFPTAFVNAKAQSLAVYGQATVTLPILDERLDMTFGGRYTTDDKSGNRTQFDVRTFDADWHHFDPSVIVDYRWSDRLSTYAKWSTAYRAGGASLRSTSFLPYDEEEVETFEIGFKSELWDRRVRLNAALFTSDYLSMQIDVTDPTNIAIAETINAANTVEVKGVEIDLAMVPLEGLVINMNYTYLNGDMPLQPNPLAPLPGGGFALEQFEISQTPKHAGALSVNYTLSPWRYGTLSANIGMTGTDEYAYLPASKFNRIDGYTLFNARLTLSDIGLGGMGKLKISAWGRNLSDEEYVVIAFPVGDPIVSVTQAFGAPRTLGLDMTYEF